MGKHTLDGFYLSNDTLRFLGRHDPVRQKALD